jgi:hypothetical protein
MANVTEIEREVLSKRGRYAVIRDNLQAKEVTVGDGERRKRYILCYNPKEAERQRHHRERIIQTLEAELKLHRDHAATAQWAIELLASRRIEAHVKICGLALMIERVPELECGLPWSRIRRQLDRLQVTEFFDLKNRVLMRNVIPAKTANILKALKIQTPKQILELENRA